MVAPSYDKFTSKPKDSDSGQISKNYFDIHMPGARPKKDDEYFCSGFPIESLVPGEEEFFVTKFEALATAKKVKTTLNEPAKGIRLIFISRHIISFCMSAKSRLSPRAKSGIASITKPAEEDLESFLLGQR